jgi:hypothetical protein
MYDVFRNGFISKDVERGLTFFKLKSAHLEFLNVAPKAATTLLILESRSTKILHLAMKELGTDFNLRWLYIFTKIRRVVAAFGATFRNSK